MADKKILVVDNDPRSLDDLARILKPLRFQIVKAADGLAAYDLFRSEKPDLVVLEALLPKMHGFDLAKKINQESMGQVPVIIVTGLYRGPQYRHEALSSFGAVDYFEKPVDAARFGATIKHILHEDEDIDDELPDPNAVLESLSLRVLGNAGRRGGPSPAEKGPHT